jgi:hypothetical protein
MFMHGLMLWVMLAAAPHPQANSTGPAIKEFNDRVQRYWDLHKKIESSAPAIDKKKEPDPAVIIQHERSLADGIRAARSNAAEGDIFTPSVQRVFLDTIHGALPSGKGTKAREMILGEGNPRGPESEARVTLAVNAKYPTTAPLSTVPPSLLLSLPKVPEGLEYRFVGRHLILFDSKANLIVDILRNAIR